MHTLLGVRTDFSLGESIISCGDLGAIANDVGATVVGVVDTMTVSSLVEATKALAKVKTATDEPIQLVSGVRVRVIMEADKEQDPAYLKLFPVNERGMQSIYRLLTRSFEADRFYYVPRVTWADLADTLENNCLVITTGDLESVTQRDDMLAALATLSSQVSFSASFIELMPSNTPYYSRQNARAIEWGAKNNFEPLVISPSLWVGDHKQAYSINASIAERRPYMDYLVPAPDYVPHDPQALATAVVAASKALTLRYGAAYGSAFSQGLKNTVPFVEMCSYRWAKQEPSLPVIAAEPDLALKELCMKGWTERFNASIFNHCPTPDELKSQYLPRLQFELNTLKSLGFAQYFLLVADLVRWSKANGIYVGPGRGSIGGSLVAYLTGITDVDPIRFNLLFERFINPDRLDLPDADLDFMSGRRGEVVRYLTNKYGEENVAGIVNYNTMGARSAVRDVGRIFGLAGDDLAATKTVGAVHGVSQSLTEAFETSPELQGFADQQPVVWASAVKLEGKMRSYGTHAAGVIVSGVPIVTRSVIERRGDARVINWDKRVSEEQGLIKLDILGLSTLDMFDQAINLIFKRHSLKLNINDVDLYDVPTLEIFTTARTAGVFQFEGGSVRRLLKEMAKSATLTFEDLVALNALNRPGPLDAGLTESYIRRRAGQEAVTYPDPVLEPVLKTTYGVITYQEQVMQVSRVLCGFTPGEADTLRKIMGKKQPIEMAKQRDKFVDGAVSVSGMDRDKADDLFTMIEGFAGYAFNRSHAVEYTLIAFQAAYLKAHYLVEFYAASMGIADEDKLTLIAKQAATDGVRVIPPDINVSTSQFEPLNDVIIAAPLSAVRNVSQKGAAAIMHARAVPTVVEKTSGRGAKKVTVQETHGPGPFKSIEDFIQRVPGKAVNSRAIEHLNRVGAFARIEPGQRPSTCATRQRDQIELMPAISDQGVVANRTVAGDEATGMAIEDIMERMFATIGKHAVPINYLSDKPKFMVILDAPFNDYEDIPKPFSFKEFVAPSLRAAGLVPEDAAWTWLLRRPKAKGETHLPAAEIAMSLPFLLDEITVSKPPVIVLLGNAVVKSLFPDIKSPNDCIGKQFFRNDFDATVIIGFNPTQIYHDDDKREILTSVFETAKKLIEINA